MLSEESKTIERWAEDIEKLLNKNRYNKYRCRINCI